MSNSLPGKQYKFVSKALSPETFSVVEFKGFEGISTLYQFDIILISNDERIDLKQVIKNTATFTIIYNDDETFFHGILSEFKQLNEVNGTVFYKAVLVPRLWESDRVHENQLFLNKTIPEILKEIFHQAGLTSLDYDFKMLRKYSKWEFICQFRETDYHFISRWMEREGIYFYFEQNNNKEIVVITDNLVRHKELSGDYFYSPISGLAPPDKEIITKMYCSQNTLPKNVVLKDYNYRTPNIELIAKATVDPEGRGEEYYYGDHFKTRKDGKVLAKIWAEGLKCRETVFDGESTAPSFCPGFYFNVKDHYRHEFNTKYLITNVVHEGSQSAHMISGLDSQYQKDHFYKNSFTAIPAMNKNKAVQFRAKRLTKKPRFYGTINAKIDSTGDGQYAEIDDLGRYKVILPFDRSGNDKGKASRWVRMAQPYSGEGYGMHFPLHKGVEVLLTFIDGDPDRPIISGSVPNPETSSPVTGGNQTSSVIKTGGGNQIAIEDTDTSQQIALYSPTEGSKISIGAPNEGNIYIKTAGTLVKKVKGVEKYVTEGDVNKKYCSNEIVEIEKDSSKHIIGNKYLNVGKDSLVSITGDSFHRVLSGSIYEVSDNQSEKIGGSQYTHVKKFIEIQSLDSKIDIKASTEIYLKVGSSSLTMKADGTINLKGTKVTIDGSDEVLVKNKSIKLDAESIDIVGKNTVNIKQKEINVNGTKVSITGKDEVNIKEKKINIEGTSNVKVKGDALNLESTNVNTIKGSVVKIN